MSDDSKIKAHRAYLEQHKREHPFPVDGSDWSRLVNMRLDRDFHHRLCACESCDNLLTRAHSLNGPLEREHATNRRALSYWLFHEAATTGRVKPLFHTDETTNDQTVRSLSEVTPGVVTLAQAEADWLKKRQKAWQPAEGKFWVPDTTEENEAHPEGHGDSRAIEANKLSATDKAGSEGREP